MLSQLGGGTVECSPNWPRPHACLRLALSVLALSQHSHGPARSSLSSLLPFPDSLAAHASLQTTSLLAPLVIVKELLVIRQAAVGAFIVLVALVLRLFLLLLILIERFVERFTCCIIRPHGSARRPSEAPSAVSRARVCAR